MAIFTFGHTKSIQRCVSVGQTDPTDEITLGLIVNNSEKSGIRNQSWHPLTHTLHSSWFSEVRQLPLRFNPAKRDLIWWLSSIKKPNPTVLILPTSNKAHLTFWPYKVDPMVHVVRSTRSNGLESCGVDGYDRPWKFLNRYFQLQPSDLRDQTPKLLISTFVKKERVQELCLSLGHFQPPQQSRPSISPSITSLELLPATRSFFFQFTTLEHIPRARALQPLALPPRSPPDLPLVYS